MTILLAHALMASVDVDGGLLDDDQALEVLCATLDTSGKRWAERDGIVTAWSGGQPVELEARGVRWRDWRRREDALAHTLAPRTPQTVVVALAGPDPTRHLHGVCAAVLGRDWWVKRGAVATWPYVWLWRTLDAAPAVT